MGCAHFPQLRGHPISAVALGLTTALDEICVAAQAAFRGSQGNEVFRCAYPLPVEQVLILLL